MIKIKKATKRIAAVAASAAMVSASVFGAGLSNYPQNFVSGGEFQGSVVVGAAAQAMDSTSAQSIIDDLAAEFSGENEKVKITYRSSSSGGETISAVKSNKQLNYGETIGAVTETAGFDKQDLDVLEERRFDNDISDEDYQQTITLQNGEFNYALRDEVDGVDEIMDGVFYDNGDSFAVYTLTMDNSIDLSGANFDQNLIGHELNIMGNDFTIVEATADGSDNMDKLVLVGGANKVSLGEGDSTTVTVEGKSYEVSVQSVSTDKVLLTVNGQSKSVDQYDTEDIAGVTIAVTDLVSSSRDSVKGYAEIVVGGQKVSLEAGNIQVNEEDLEDMFPDYDIDVAFSGTGMEIITITYSVDDDTLLQEGDRLTDVLFDSFEIVYRGTNEPDYSWVSLSTTKKAITIDGELENGDSIPSELGLYYDSEGVSGGNLTIGDDDFRVFTEDSRVDRAAAVDGVAFNVTSGNLTFDVSDNDIKDYGFLYAKDLDDQFLYIISAVDNNNLEVNFNDLIGGKDETDVELDAWDNDLEDGATYVLANTTTSVIIDVAELHNPVVTLAGALKMDLSDAEDVAMTTTADASLTFSLDNTESEVDGDDADDELDAIVVDISFPTDADDKLDIKVANGNSDIENFANADNEDGTDDAQTFVTSYGIMVEYDNQEYDSVRIGVPSEQVEGLVDLVFGNSGSTEMSVIVDADDADDKEAELEDDGYTIVKTETVSSEEVEFDVSAPVMDSEVSGMDDMIVVGGPAVNKVAAMLLGLSYPTYGSASGVDMGEAVIKYYADSNSVLVYGYAKEDTAAAAKKLNAGGLSGSSVNI